MRDKSAEFNGFGRDSRRLMSHSSLFGRAYQFWNRACFGRLWDGGSSYRQGFTFLCQHWVKLPIFWSFSEKNTDFLPCFYLVLSGEPFCSRVEGKMVGKCWGCGLELALGLIKTAWLISSPFILLFYLRFKWLQFQTSYYVLQRLLNIITVKELNPLWDNILQARPKRKGFL